MKKRKSNKKFPENHYLASERLISIIVILSDNRWHTTERLASLFGTTTRTILRDLDKIENSTKVIIERKRGKGIRFLERYNFKGINADENEAINLILAVAFSAGIGFSVVQIAKTLSKLRDSLPSEFFESISIFQNRFYFENSDSISKNLEIIRKAIIQSSIILFCYNGQERKVNPYGLIYHRTKFYLVGYDNNHKEIRAFSVNKIQKSEILDEKFKFPEEFDVKNYWQKKFWKKYYKKAETIILVLENNTKNNFLERIENWEKTKIKKVADKSTEITFKTLNFEWLRNFILSCGKNVKVKKPDWLKKEIKKEIQEMNKLYVSRISKCEQLN